MKYICFDGCIGSGKTTLSNMLAKELNGKVLLENFESHPFLTEFYKCPDKYNYETELGFLLIHYHQIYKYVNDYNLWVSDFYLGKDLLFAEANLKNKTEKKIFRDLYTYLLNKAPKPDVIIYLCASTELLYDRVKKRNRIQEDELSYDYLMHINSAYVETYSRVETQIPIIKVDMDKHDFLTDNSCITALKREIDALFGCS